MHWQQPVLMMPWIMSWLVHVMVVSTSAATAASSISSGMVGSVAVSHVIARPQLVQESRILGHGTSSQSTEGLLVQQTSSSALVVISNTSFLPAPSSFALSQSANTVQPFFYHSSSSPPIQTQIVISKLSDLPTIMQSSSSLSTLVAKMSSSSSVSKSLTESELSPSLLYSAPNEHNVANQDVPPLGIKAYPSDIYFVQTDSFSVVMTKYDVASLQSFPETVSAEVSSLLTESATDVLQQSKSTVQLEATQNPALGSLAPSPSQPLPQQVDSSAMWGSSSYTATAYFAHDLILPSFDMYSGTMGLRTATASQSVLSSPSEVQSLSLKTPSLINDDQMSMSLTLEHMSPVTSDDSLKSVGASYEQSPVHASLSDYVGQMAGFVDTSTSTALTFQSPVPILSEEYSSVYSSKVNLSARKTVVIVSPATSMFLAPEPSASTDYSSVHRNILVFPSKTNKDVAIETATTSTFQVLTPSEEHISLQTRHLISTNKITEVITMTPPMVSGLHVPVPSHSFQSEFMTDFPDNISSDNAVTVTNYQTPSLLNVEVKQSTRTYGSAFITPVSGIASTMNILDAISSTVSVNRFVNTALHEVQSTISLATLYSQDYDGSAKTTLFQLSNLNSEISPTVAPHSLSIHLRTPALHFDQTKMTLPSRPVAFVSSLLHAQSSYHLDHLPSYLDSESSLLTASVAVFALPSVTRSLQPSVDHGINLNLTPTPSMPEGSILLFKTYHYESFASSLSLPIESTQFSFDIRSNFPPSISGALTVIASSSVEHLHSADKQPSLETILSMANQEAQTVVIAGSEISRTSHAGVSSSEHGRTPQLSFSSHSLEIQSLLDVDSLDSVSSSFPQPLHSSSSLVELITTAIPSSRSSQFERSLLHSHPAFSSPTKPLQLASLSFHASRLPLISSMFGGASNEAFSPTKTPPLTASFSLHASPTYALSSRHDGHSSQIFHQMSQTDRIQRSSRRLLAATSGTVTMATSSSTYVTLDRSFSTDPYWLKLDATIPEDIDIKSRDYIVTMETNLATAYSEGKRRKEAREAAVQELLQNLNPDNDPLLNKRRKRAVTVDGNTAQIIDLSRDATYPANVRLVFYLAEGDTSMPAGESKAIFSELTLQELTFYLQVVIKSSPTEYIEPVVVTTTPAPSIVYVWIILGVIGGSGLLLLACCCCFCICCRRPLKPSRDGPMDMDALKMLQHQQKYPYKPYKTPSQTPRGFDVAKETDGTKDVGVASEAGGSVSGVKLQNSATGSILKNQLHSVSTRVDLDPSDSSDSLSASGGIPDIPSHQLQGLQYSTAKGSADENEEEFHKAASVELGMSGRSQQSSGMYQPRLLPLRTQMSHDGDEWNRKLRHKPPVPSSKGSSLSTSRETDELRRIYQEAQREISRALEPDIIPDESHLAYVAPDRRKKARGRSSKRRRQAMEQETEFGGDHSLPDTHYARTPSKKQITSRRQPEALQEARRKVHNLIDEAFSLVGLPKNAISPAPPLATSTPPIATDDEEQTSKLTDNKSLFQRKVSDSGPSSSTVMKEKDIFTSAVEQGRKSRNKREVEEANTRVVVVPVTHQPDKSAGIVWNPYHAEDEITQLQKSQQLTLIPGGTESIHKPRDVASHLNIPHPASVPEASKEPWMKEFTPQHEGEDTQQPVNQRQLPNNQEELMSASKTKQERDSPDRRPSTSLRRLSNDSDTLELDAATDGPYMDSYLKRNFSGELNGTFTLSHCQDGPTSKEEDHQAVALARSSNRDRDSTKPNHDHQQQSAKGDTDSLSILPKERRVGKPIADGYDEFDVSREVTSRDKSGQLVAAVRDELIRLAKRSGQHESSF